MYIKKGQAFHRREAIVGGDNKVVKVKIEKK